MLKGIDAAHFAGNLNGKRRRIKGGDPPYSASRVSKSIPQFFASVSKRGNTAKAANDYAARPPITASIEWHWKIIQRRENSNLTNLGWFPLTLTH